MLPCQSTLDLWGRSSSKKDVKGDGDSVFRCRPRPGETGKTRVQSALEKTDPAGTPGMKGTAMLRTTITATLCLLSLSRLLLAGEAEVTYLFTDGKTERHSVPLEADGHVQRLRLKAADLPSGLSLVELRTDFAVATTGEEGYFVMPNGFLGTFRLQEGDQALAGNCMPIFGMKTPRAAFVAIVTGMPHGYTLMARARNGRYSLFPRFNLNGQTAYDDIAVEYHMLQGDDASYSGMARVYRNYQLARKACVPLKDRIGQCPEIAYAAQSIEVRIRQAWKPAPSPVEEQTPETEPAMKVAVTFDRVGEILDAFKQQGIDRAQVCLVGWNRKGHDGRYPQLFPVEEELGGEEKLRQLIARAQRMGFQMVGHTNSSDAYRISEVWDEEYIIKNPDGSLSTNANWSGGRMYNVCPQCAYERFVPKDLRAVARLGFRGVHYIDVLTIVRPRACYDPRHPLNRNQSAVWIDRIMRECKDNIGAVASEGPYDFCCGNLDYVLYVSFAKLSPDLPEMVDRIVPIWQLVYHGIILSNPFADTTNYTIKGDLGRLKLVEFGGRPLFYFHSRFAEGRQWMGADDITCADREALAHGVARIKEGYDEFQERMHLQVEFMEEHEQLVEGVFRTAFSDGSVIITNYRDETFSYRDTKVEPRDYRVVAPSSREHHP